jgi:hypothetical protein
VKYGGLEEDTPLLEVVGPMGKGQQVVGGSETLAFNNQTPGKYPKDYTQDSKHGESLKSTICSIHYFTVVPD